VSAFWSEYIRHADDEIGRLMHRDADWRSSTPASPLTC
jgi:hypothetical protein